MELKWGVDITHFPFSSSSNSSTEVEISVEHLCKEDVFVTPKKTCNEVIQKGFRDLALYREVLSVVGTVMEYFDAGVW